MKDKKNNIDIEKLQELMDDHILNYNVQIEKLNEDISKVSRQGTKIEELPKWINDAKKDITIFTFELIATIVGFLSLLLAIIVLTVNQGEINSELVYVYATFGLCFIILFGIFVYFWIKKNFPKVEGDDYKKIISYINNKNSQLVDYIDSKISDVVGDLIKSSNSNMNDCIKEEISKCCGYIDDKIVDCCKYTDGKISDVIEFIKKDKNK